MHEECGVFGIWSPVKKDLPQIVYLGLYALQHRGQESCGIAVSCNGVFHSFKGYGMVGKPLTGNPWKDWVMEISL